MSSSNRDRPTAGELVPVKFSRLTRRGVLLGLSLTQLITLAIGGITLISAFYAGGGMLLSYTPHLETRWRADLDTHLGSSHGGVAAHRLLVAVAYRWRANAVPAQERRPSPCQNPCAARRYGATARIHRP